MEEIKRECDEKLEEARCEHDQKVGEVRSECNRKLGEAQSECNQKLENAASEYDRKLKEKERDRIHQLETFRDELEQMISRLGGLKDKIHLVVGEQTGIVVWEKE